MDIDAYLKAKVDMRKIKPPLKIEGEFMLNYTDNTIDELNQTTIRVCSLQVYKIIQTFYCQLFSDFILEEQPTTVEETFQVFKDISKNFGNWENEYKYSSPMHAQLLPIKVVSLTDLLSIFLRVSFGE